MQNGFSGEILSTLFMPYASRSHFHGTGEMPEMRDETEESKNTGTSNENGMLHVITDNTFVDNCLKFS